MSTRPTDPVLHPAQTSREPTASPGTTAVRAWARSRGYPIDETAGVPSVVLTTYGRVHGG